MQLPLHRGPVSRALTDSLRDGTPLDVAALLPLVEAGADVVRDEDLQLALWTAYELHYGGLDGVDDAREWDPELLRVRGALETRLEDRLRELTAAGGRGARRPRGRRGPDVRQTNATDGPSLSRFLQREATAEQFREVLVHRSVYQLKEADPHTFVVPRLPGSARSRSSSSSSTSTAPGGPSASTRGCSRRGWPSAGWTGATARTSTWCRLRRSR